MKVDVFLLAAGESQRMFPLSQIMEKSLLPVDGKPVIRHIIENLTQPEVAKHLRKITICCLSKFKKQFEHEFRDMPSIEFKTFTAPMGTVNTTIFFEDFHTSSKYIMVHYADCLTEIDYVDFISSFFNRCDIDKYDGSIAVTNQVKHDYSEVDVYPATLKVTGFYEKPQIKNYTWSGIGLFHMENLMENYNINYMKSMDFAFDIFPNMIEEDRLIAYPYNGYWYDMGNLNSYRKVCNQFDNEEK